MISQQKGTNIMHTTIERQRKKETQHRFKKCYFCNEIIHIEAKKCKHCGEFLDPKLKASRVPEQKLNPVTVALFSLLVPGGGHIYSGKPIKGFLWLLFTAVGYGLYILPGMFLHLISIIFAVTDNPTEE